MEFLVDFAGVIWFIAIINFFKGSIPNYAFLFLGLI